MRGAQLGYWPDRADRAHFEQLATDHGLQPVRWPPVYPADTGTAMLVATYAKQIGRAVAFSLAAFRQEFAGGRDLGDVDTLLIAAAACEMHPSAVLKAIGRRSVASALERAGGRALAAGVQSLPAIQTGGELFEGEHALRDAAGVGS